MPRFYFDLRTDGRLETDTEGLEFPSFESAYLEAFQAAREIWAEMLQARRDPRDLAFEIYDAERQLLATLPFAEVLEATKSSRGKADHPARRRLQDQFARMHRAQEALRSEFALARETIAKSQELLRRARLKIRKQS